MSDEELELIKRRKFLQMMKIAAKKSMAEGEQKGERSETEREKEQFFIIVMTPEAKRYLDKLKTVKPAVAEKIENAIVYMFANRLINRKITEIDVMRMERKIEGVEPKIVIKKRGEDRPLDLAEALKRD